MNTKGPELTVGAVPRHYAGLEPHKIALRDARRSLTYRELDTRSEALAAWLVAQGIGSGQVVCAFLPNCIDYLIVVFAVARSGAIFSPINPRYKAREVAAILEQARPKVVFTTRDRRAMVQGSAQERHLDNVLLVDVNLESGPDTLATLCLPSRTPCQLPSVSEGDFFSLMFTSGTTGEPKGVLATHRARMLWVLNATIQYGLTERDVYLGTMPQVHSAGLTFTLMHLYAGATVRIEPSFDAERFIRIVREEGITSALTVPTMLTMIIEAMGRVDMAQPFGTLKRLVTCGSPLPLATKERVLQLVTTELFDYYGSTESNSMTVLQPADQLRKPNSVGKPFRNVEIMIAGSDGRPCGPGVAGEVWCANPSAMTAYHNRPEDTQRAFTGRWFHTGDVGFLDEDGFLHLVGRKDDVIISGGVNIYPPEIEQVLMLHPAVLDAAVVGIEDPIWGQTLKAFLVLRQGERLDLAQVQQHCVAHLADFKKPRAVVFVSSLPKNAGGKTIKAALSGHSPLPTEMSLRHN
ncbi:MAG TPA: AMP-binding protein [Burkholderiales bacterium]|nr:AMP-binding protein [Burkholderiales bacterium]